MSDYDFIAQKSDTPKMLEEQIEIYGDALGYHKDRKAYITETVESGIGGSMLERELEAINKKIAWYITRIEDVKKFMEGHVYDEDMLKRDKYPWVAV